MQAKEILVRNSEKSKTVAVENVVYIESNNRKVILHTEKEIIEYYAKISELEELLKPEFFRIHKGYLVHMKYIKEYGRTSVCMMNGDNLLISKYRYQNFIKAYQDYKKRQESGKK